MSKPISLILLSIILLAECNTAKHFHYHLSKADNGELPLLDVSGIVKCLQTQCETIRLNEPHNYNKCAEGCMIKARAKKGYQ